MWNWLKNLFGGKKEEQNDANASMNSEQSNEATQSAPSEMNSGDDMMGESGGGMTEEEKTQ